MAAPERREAWRSTRLRACARRWRGAAGPVLLGLGLVSLLGPAPARAFGLGDLLGGGASLGSIVYDPTNHLETAVSAAQSVRQTALQVRAEIQRLQQLAIEVEQLRSLPGTTVRAALADWNGQLGVLMAAGDQLARIDQLVGASQQRTADQLRQIAALGVSPRTWLQREVDAALRRQQSAEVLFSAERSGLDALSRARQSLSRLQDQIPSSSGVQQSMQTTNQYLDLLAGQTSQLLSLQAAQAATQARQRSSQEADAALAGAREAERTQRDLDDIATLRGRLREQESSQGWGLLQPLASSRP